MRALQTLHLREQARKLVGQESSGRAKVLGHRSDYDLGYLALSRLGGLDTGPACMPGVLSHSSSEFGADYDLN